ncbi:MAG: RelA/SpoT family protein [Cardiobacteriaceae bacterium]|nr:RelA/SpoT family protein [Cardiobacteriaceae bacterium]
MPVSYPLVSNPFAEFYGSELLNEHYQLLEQAISQYLNPSDVEKVLAAAVFGAQAHDGQKRKSGEPYFTHPIQVALILAKSRFDVPVLQAALLHDVLEDTPVTKEQMTRHFGLQVANIVDGVSKLYELKHKGPLVVQAETFRHLLISCAKDPRVILIKLADRLHNLQTLDAFKDRPDKQKRIAKETMDIYVPIADRLGLFLFRIELEDLAFSYLFPWRYAVINHHYKAQETRKRQESSVKAMHQEIEPLFKALGISASVQLRPRYLSNIYQRMKRKGSFHESMKTHSIRILTDSIDNCYRILGCLHSRYRPIENKLNDYIGSPKSNGYRSLHTSVVNEVGQVFNVQIRTHSMHALAEMGIVAVWHQKLKNQLNQEEESHSVNVNKNMREFLTRIKDIQDFTHDPEEFYATVKAEMGAKDIRVFTPDGKPIDLPLGATPIDFAYAIHTNIGHHCVAAIVNGRDYPITQVLQHGQTVSIKTDPNAHPHPRWVEQVASPRAKTAVRDYFKKVSFEQASDMGKKRFAQAAARYLNDEVLIQARLEHYLLTNQLDKETVFAEIGYGKRQSSLLAAHLFDDYPLLPASTQAIKVQSALHETIHLASCCRPLPHEPITGALDSKTDGITIHRRDCPTTKSINQSNWVSAEWAEEVQGLFATQLLIDCIDRRGLLNEITHITGDSIDIRNLKIENHPETKTARLIIDLGVANRSALARVMARLRSVEGILKLSRT